jgi:hypothetical protein
MYNKNIKDILTKKNLINEEEIRKDNNYIIDINTE